MILVVACSNCVTIVSELSLYCVFLHAVAPLGSRENVGKAWVCLRCTTKAVGF